jgi:hypothetical protein
MRPATFTGTILDGHKGAAVEVPFDPTARWGIPPRSLWRGRRGHRVWAEINGAAVDTAVVPRSRSFFLLLDEASLAAAGVAVGHAVKIRIAPVAG